MKVSLFYANWCGHCKHFLPTWNTLKNEFKKNNIDFAEYEDSVNGDIMQKKQIEGFPTIKIEHNGNEYDYNGSRDVASILNEVMPNSQFGGFKEKKRYQIYYGKY